MDYKTVFIITVIVVGLVYLYYQTVRQRSLISSLKKEIKELKEQKKKTLSDNINDNKNSNHYENNENEVIEDVVIEDVVTKPKNNVDLISTILPNVGPLFNFIVGGTALGMNKNDDTDEEDDETETESDYESSVMDNEDEQNSSSDSTNKIIYVNHVQETIDNSDEISLHERCTEEKEEFSVIETFDNSGGIYSKTCVKILSSGKNKGNLCGKSTTNGNYCKLHIKMT